jgi:GTP-binding protein
VLVADASMRDLQTFHRRPHYKAGHGGHGEGSNRHGASADPLEVRVPPGTSVRDPERESRWDLTVPGQRVVVARAGLGGRGNRHFTGPTRQAPRFAERGLAGEEAWIELRLRLLADAGLVGVPNAGKSSLLARMTAARPKVAGYPFTTIEPVLGTIEAAERQLVIADIPGLIEGASAGAGLGHEFLAHVERTRLLVHVLDLAPLDGSDPLENHASVEAELREHGAGLERLPRIICLSKADLVTPERQEEAVSEWRERLGGAALDVLVTSAATGQGVDQLKQAIVANVPLDEAPAASEPEAVAEERPLAEHRVYRPRDESGFQVEKRAEGGFRVTGPRVERLIARHDVDNDEALRYIEDRLRGLGVIRSLEGAGFEPGDDVEIAGIVFDLDPGARFGT